MLVDELAAAVAVPVADAAASDAVPIADASAVPASDAVAVPVAVTAPASDAAPVPIELDKAPVPATEDHDVRVLSTGASAAPPAPSVANYAVVESHTSIGGIQVITGVASASAMDVDHNVDQMNIDSSDFIEGMLLITLSCITCLHSLIQARRHRKPRLGFRLEWPHLTLALP